MQLHILSLCERTTQDIKLPILMESSLLCGFQDLQLDLSSNPCLLEWGDKSMVHRTGLTDQHRTTEGVQIVRDFDKCLSSIFYALA
jgi:hypothetical protein